MQERPGSVTAVAILSIIVGSLGLIMYCICGFWAITLLNPAAVHFADLRSIPGYMPMTLITFIVNMILSSLFLTSGIGMLLMGQWARILTIICSFVNLLTHLTIIIYNFAVVKPAMARLPANVIREVLFGHPDQQILLALLVGAFEIIFSITAIIILLLPGVGSAFEMAGRFAGRNRYDDDRDDYRPPRRYRDDEDW